MRFELLINDDPFGFGISPNSFLDTFQEESISLNYNIADVTDISKKNSSYSKTIQLPDTKNNRLVFTNIFNIENTGENINNFDTNRKVKCWVLADSIIIFKGNLQLTNIVYDYENNRHLYEVVIYSDNDSLFKVIGEQYLTDLNLSRYDHTYTKENIEKSWGLTQGGYVSQIDFTNGYFYPLIDYGFPLYYPEQGQTNYPIKYSNLYPSVYAKILFDSIFSEAGFSYTSTFLNSSRFTDLIVPFNNGIFKPNPLVILGNDNLLFSAVKSFTSSATFSQYVQQGSGLSPYEWRSVGSLEVDSDLFDPNNLYNGLTFSYTNPSNETFKQRFSIYFKLKITSQLTWSPWTFNKIKIYCKRNRNLDGTINTNFNNSPIYEQLQFPTFPTYIRDIPFNGGVDRGIRIDNSLLPQGTYKITKLPDVVGIPSSWIFEGTITTDWLIDSPLLPGEKVKFFIFSEFSNYPATSGGPPKLFLDLQILPETKIWSEIDPTVAVFGSNISLTDSLPTKIKQKDFIISIFKMFNLYIEPSIELENHFLIEPRDEYYAKYLIAKDWSSKLDLSKSITSQILSNLQKRTNLFTYKSDKDFYNENYTTNTNQIFGQFKFEIDNDFISGDNKIETIFSPTPIDKLPGPADFYLPIIANYNNGNYTKVEGMNIRILYRKMIPVTNNPFILIDQFTNVQNSYVFYPYCGPDDDPLNPNYTLNFGSVSPYRSEFNNTLKNLFNTYYRNQITELNDKGSRLISANFNLDYNDINTFKFSDLIYCTIGGMSSWYRVVKINDYDPLSKATTKVDLIKAYNYKLPDPTGATPSVEFCWIRMEFILSTQEAVDLLSVITSYANSEFPYLTFYNIYDNTPFSYPYPVTEGLGFADLEMWSSSLSPSLGFSIDYNSVNGSQTIAQKKYVPCGTGPYELRIVMSSALNNISNVNPILFSAGNECSCENLNRVSPYTEDGLRNAVPLDNIYIGILNTSITNKTSYPNVAMVGSNNIIDNVGILTIGDSNTGSGQNSILVGQNNGSSGEQSFIVGDGNINYAKNALTIGSDNIVSSPQSFVFGVGNQLQFTSTDSYTFSAGPGTTSFYGTYSLAATQSSFIIGNTNNIYNNSGFVYGDSNSIDISVINPFIYGSNNNIGLTFGASFSFPLNNLVLFGNNNNIINTTTQSTSNSFIIGNNITLTQSLPSDTFYIGSQTVEINSTQIITNVTGTASFNKITIGNINIDGSQIVYNDVNANDFIISRVGTSSEDSYINFQADSSILYISSNPITNLIITESQVPTTSPFTYGLWDRTFTDNNVGYSSQEQNRHFVGITTTSSTVFNQNVQASPGFIFTLETTIIGNDNPNFYFSKKIASYGDGNQIGTTTTIYENTNFATWSVDLNVDSSYANVALAGGPTQSVVWKLYTTIYYH